MNLVTAGRQRIRHGADVLAHYALHRHARAADRARHQERPGFDAIGNDVVLGAVQFFYAFDN